MSKVFVFVNKEIGVDVLFVFGALIFFKVAGFLFEIYYCIVFVAHSVWGLNNIFELESELVHSVEINFLSVTFAIMESTLQVVLGVSDGMKSENIEKPLRVS